MKDREKSTGRKQLPTLVEIPTVSFGSSALFDEREKLRVEYRWISNRRALLAKKYAEMYVAVKDKQVLLPKRVCVHCWLSCVVRV
jgi:hypothetical protein